MTQQDRSKWRRRLMQMLRNVVTVAALAFTLACQKPPCPPLARLERADPIADARSAASRGDHRLLMLGGVVGTAPGSDGGASGRTKFLEGTSDTETEACARMRPVAERYALAYNMTMLGRHAPQ